MTGILMLQAGFFDEGQVITLEKGYRAENASWQIVTMNNKTDKLKYSYGAQNLTAAADFTNTTGIICLNSVLKLRLVRGMSSAFGVHLCRLMNGRLFGKESMTNRKSSVNNP